MFDKKKSEIILALIFHHENINGENISCTTYNGKPNKNGKGVTYTFNDFPEELKKIITLYVISSIL